jgi:tRNA(Ile)-lysidine synthase
MICASNDKGDPRLLQPKRLEQAHPFVDELSRSYCRLLNGRPASLLLAVSGGTDSAALLWGTARLASALGLRLEVASMDHGLRPESGLEVAGVREWASKLELPFHARLLSLQRGAALEARAREARYAALEALRSDRVLDFLVTAHTCSDQAETVLMRLGRGAALRGMRGIAHRKGVILRPMLGMSRSCASDFVRRIGCRPFEDPSNQDPGQLRARIRHRLLPFYAEIIGISTESLSHRLSSFARLAAEDESLLQEWADRAYRQLALIPGHLDAVGVRSLQRPLRRRVLARLLEEAGLTIDGQLVDRVDAAVLKSRRATLPARRWLETSGGVIRLNHADGGQAG